MSTDGDAPQSAADPRPGGEPYYIDSDCPECGTPLVLHDELSDEELRSSESFADPEFMDSKVIWHDEWACPNCLDGIHMDWPPELERQWSLSLAESEGVPIPDWMWEDDK